MGRRRKRGGNADARRERYNKQIQKNKKGYEDMSADEFEDFVNSDTRAFNPRNPTGNHERMKKMELYGNSTNKGAFADEAEMNKFLRNKRASERTASTKADVTNMAQGAMQQYGGGQSPKGQQGQQGGGSPKGQPQMQNNSGAQPGSYMDRMRNSRAEQGVGGYEQFAPTQAPRGGSPKGGGGSPKGQPQPTRSAFSRRRPQGRPNPYESQGYQQPARRRRAYNPETGLIE